MPPPVIAIVGAPNAGKSTLFNRLLGRRRALVHERPGMTRDVIEAETLWDGRRFVLLDTGGLLPPGSPEMADQVTRLAVEAARRSDLLIFVVDGRAGLTVLDAELGRMLHENGLSVVLAVNKLDVPGREQQAGEFHALGFEPVIAISAEHGLGIGDLREAVEERLASARRRGTAPEEASGAAVAGEIRVALMGRPNVGKSSLLNRLLGQERTLVSEVPGTTRDTIDSLARRGKRTYRFVDTAGIRRSGRVERGPEALSVMAARRSAAGADVVVVLMDATEAPTMQDLHVAGIARDECRPFAVLLNKWDLVAAMTGGHGPDPGETPDRVRSRLRFAPFAPVLTVSALTGLRIEKVFPLIDQIHEQATRKISTGTLNAWLEDALTAHPPPSPGGHRLKLYYAAQKGVNPPAFVVFTSRTRQPHFSYSRYLENSMRQRFGLTHTPVILTYRQSPHRTGSSAVDGKKGRRRRV